MNLNFSHLFYIKMFLAHFVFRQNFQGWRKSVILIRYFQQGLKLGAELSPMKKHLISLCPCKSLHTSWGFICLLVVMLLAETVLCLAGLCCYVETTVLYTCVFVGNSGMRLAVPNIGVGKLRTSGCYIQPEIASPTNRNPFQANTECSECTDRCAGWVILCSV